MDIEVCDHRMGGIWIPHKGGGVDYKDIYCNKPKGHEENYNLSDASNHAFLDPHSGMMIQQAIAPKLTVDPRGCIKVVGKGSSASS